MKLEGGGSPIVAAFFYFYGHAKTQTSLFSGKADGVVCTEPPSAALEGGEGPLPHLALSVHPSTDPGGAGASLF